MNRYGIRAIDTSPYYGMSEVILGSVLRALASEFPRQSYHLMTKVGRYGVTKDDFDYSPQSIRLSIMRSLQRLNTTYLDAVFLHDVEFIASPVWPIPYCGDFERVLNDKEGRADWGLLPGKEGKAWGTGDETILAAVRELFKMKSEGLIRAVGISGMYGPHFFFEMTLTSGRLSPPYSSACRTSGPQLGAFPAPRCHHVLLTLDPAKLTLRTVPPPLPFPRPRLPSPHRVTV